MGSMSPFSPLTGRTTISLHGELLEQATRLAGPLDRPALLHEALRAVIERKRKAVGTARWHLGRVEGGPTRTGDSILTEQSAV
jgi:hypothetical protein